MALADYMLIELEPWKSRKFNDELPLLKVVDSLGGDRPLVFVQKPLVAGPWTVSKLKLDCSLLV